MTDTTTSDTPPQPPTAEADEREILRQLDATRDTLGSLQPTALQQAAAQLGISTRQTRRRLQQFLNGTTPRQPFTMDDDTLAVVAAHNGNLSSAYRELALTDRDLPGFTTFWRGFTQRLDTDIAGYLKAGGNGLLKGSLFALWQPEHRNDLWEIDHSELPIDVIADGCTTTVVKPWISVLIDGASRRVVAWAITADAERRPDADAVCALLAEATMEIRREGHTYGGVPGIVRCDQGAEFLGTKVSAFVTAAGIDLQPVFPRSGYLKGKIERFFRTMETEFCTPQHGFTHGIETRTGRHPFRDVELMTSDELRRRTLAWMHHYNGSRPHSSLGQATPDSVWQADTTPLRFLPGHLVRDHLLESTKTPKVTTKGVSFAGTWWTNEQLHGKQGRRLHVRFPIFHTGFIELYTGSQWLCTATPTLTGPQVRELLARRRDNHGHARDIVRNATQRRAAANRHVADNPAAPLPRAAMADVDPLAGDIDALEELTARRDRPTQGDRT